MNWQPIETAPKSKLFLAWMEGYERHNEANWRRSGYALMAIHDDGPDKHLLDAAIDRIMGMAIPGFPIEARHLEPVEWAPLPEPPEKRA